MTKPKADRHGSYRYPRREKPKHPLRRTRAWLGQILKILRLGRPNSRVFLHLGAHKTGTTYCQTVLKNNQEKLRKAGVVYWDLNYTRKHLTPYLVGLSRPEFHISTEECRARIEAIVRAPEFTNASRLVISDENLMGFIRHIVLKNGYKRIVRRLTPMREALGGDVTVFLTIRSYADLIASMYCEIITTKTYFPFENIRKCCFVSEFSWVKVYQDLVRVFGINRVVVFEYKAFFSNPDDYLARLAGTLIDFEYPITKIRASPSARAISYIGSESTANPEIPIREIARRAKQKYPHNAGDKPYDPWSPEERAILEERYRHDLAAIPCWYPSGELKPQTTSRL